MDAELKEALDRIQTTQRKNHYYVMTSVWAVFTMLNIGFLPIFTAVLHLDYLPVAGLILLAVVSMLSVGYFWYKATSIRI